MLSPLRFGVGAENHPRLTEVEDSRSHLFLLSRLAGLLILDLQDQICCQLVPAAPQVENDSVRVLVVGAGSVPQLPPVRRLLEYEFSRL